MQVHVTKVYSTNHKKDGTPLISAKSGKPYYRVGIKTNEHGDQWLNGFSNFDCKDWEGKTKDLEITEGEFNGQKQLNFKVQSQGGQFAKDLEELRKRVYELEQFTGIHKQTQEAPVDYPSDEIDPSNIPF